MVVMEFRIKAISPCLLCDRGALFDFKSIVQGRFCPFIYLRNMIFEFRLNMIYVSSQK